MELIPQHYNLIPSYDTNNMSVSHYNEIRKKPEMFASLKNEYRYVILDPKIFISNVNYSSTAFIENRRNVFLKTRSTGKLRKYEITPHNLSKTRNGHLICILRKRHAKPDLISRNVRVFPVSKISYKLRYYKHTSDKLLHWLTGVCIDEVTLATAPII